MPFREDEDAAEARVEALRHELAEATSDLDALRGNPSPAPHARRRWRWLLAVPVLLAVAGVVAAGLAGLLGHKLIPIASTHADWDGTAKLSCQDDVVELRHRTLKLGAGVLIDARHCTVRLLDVDLEGSPSIFAADDSVVEIHGGHYRGVVSISDSRLLIEGASLEQLDIGGVDPKAGPDSQIRGSSITKQLIVADGIHATISGSAIQEIDVKGWVSTVPPLVELQGGDVAGLVRVEGPGTLTASGTTFEGHAEVYAGGKIGGTPVLDRWEAEQAFEEPLIRIWPTLCAEVEPCYAREGVVGNIDGRLVIETGEDGAVTRTTYSGSASPAVQSCMSKAIEARPIKAKPGRAFRFQVAYAGPFVGPLPPGSRGSKVECTASLLESK